MQFYCNFIADEDDAPNEVEDGQGRSPSPGKAEPDAAPPTHTASVAVFPRLMESIHATKDIGDHTIFGGSDVPPLGVVTEHQADLEKVGRLLSHFLDF